MVAASGGLESLPRGDDAGILIVARRRAYGCHEERPFVLKVRQALDPEANALFRR